MLNSRIISFPPSSWSHFGALRRYFRFIFIIAIAITILVLLFNNLEEALDALSFTRNVVESCALWVANFVMRGRIYFIALAPSALSVLMLYFALTHTYQKTVDNNEWNEVETLIKKMNPNVNLISVITDVGGFLVGRTLFPDLGGLITLVFVISTITIFASFANWYLTAVVFKHREFSVGQETLFLVENRNRRGISWALLNLTSILLIWVLWIIFVIAITGIL